MTDRTRRTSSLSRLPAQLRSLARDGSFTAPVLLTLSLVTALVVTTAALMRPVSIWPPAVMPAFAADALAAWDWGAAFTPAAEAPASLQRDGLASLLLGLAGAVATAVALALVALTTLFSSRAAHRTRERATRSALGAGPLRLAGRDAADAATLGLAAAALGLPLGLAAIAALRASWPHGLLRPELLPGPAGWTAALALPVLLALVAAGLGALLTPPARPASLRAGARATPSAHGGRVLLIGQIGLSLALLMGAAALLRGGAEHADTGDQTGGRVMALATVLNGEASVERRATIYRDMVERLREVDGIDGVSLASRGAWLGLGARDRVLGDCGGCSIGGLVVPFTASRPRLHVVSPDSFQVLGIPVLAGREFDWTDDAGAERVAVVSRSFVAARLLGGDPIGKRVQLGGPTDPWYRVVGVVADVAPDGPGTAEGEPAVYLPLLQHPPRTATLTLASPLDPAALARTIAAALDGVSGRDGARAAGGTAALDGMSGRDEAPAAGGAAATAGAVPVVVDRFETAADRLERFAAPVRWLARLVGAVAALMLLLAAHGTRATMRHAVERRRREIGTRIALGARSRHIIGDILAAAARITLTGATLGLVIAATHPRARAALDAELFGALAAVLAVMALTGALGPGIGALRIEPAECLREE